jgi:hypothetical protein
LPRLILENWLSIGLLLAESSEVECIPSSGPAYSAPGGVADLEVNPIDAEDVQLLAATHSPIGHTILVLMVDFAPTIRGQEPGP